MSTETELSKAIRDAVNATGKAWLMRNSVVRRSFYKGGLGDGSPDLVGMLTGTGRFFALEVKMPKGGKERETQLAWHARCRVAGGYVAFVRSVDEALGQLARARE